MLRGRYRIATGAAGCTNQRGNAFFREAIDMNASLKPVQPSADAERSARVDLAACYRLADRFGLNEGIDNHLTLLVPGHDDRFLLAPYGMHWSEVKASDFLVVDFSGRI